MSNKTVLVKTVQYTEIVYLDGDNIVETERMHDDMEYESYTREPTEDELENYYSEDDDSDDQRRAS